MDSILLRFAVFCIQILFCKVVRKYQDAHCFQLAPPFIYMFIFCKKRRIKTKTNVLILYSRIKSSNVRIHLWCAPIFSTKVLAGVGVDDSCVLSASSSGAIAPGMAAQMAQPCTIALNKRRPCVVKNTSKRGNSVVKVIITNALQKIFFKKVDSCSGCMRGQPNERRGWPVIEEAVVWGRGMWNNCCHMSMFHVWFVVRTCSFLHFQIVVLLVSHLRFNYSIWDMKEVAC